MPKMTLSGFTGANPGVGATDRIQHGWFRGPIETTETAVTPVRLRWLCPQAGCTGEMIFNGELWPTGTPGYHHVCDVCGLTLARPGEKFPRVEYRETL